MLQLSPKGIKKQKKKKNKNECALQRDRWGKMVILGPFEERYGTERRKT